MTATNSNAHLGELASKANCGQSAISHTPLKVQPRRMSFPFAGMDERYFFDGNIIKSAYLTALSVTFPPGEGEFINSVRMFRDQVKDDPEMSEQIRGFIGQEAHHSQQHKQMNERLQALGFDTERLEKVFLKDMAWSLKGRSPVIRLAFTVCFEHQTAILAEQFLKNESIREGLDDVSKDLMLWHAVEEIEHKGVAFDLYMRCVGNRKLLHRAQKIAFTMFSYRIMKYMCLLMFWAGARPSWREIKDFARFMFGKQGLYRMMRKPYKEFFRDDFHPWDHDNRALIEDWKQRLRKPEQELVK